MKNKLFAFLTLALLATLDSQLSSLHAQGTAFTYQGKLNDNASPANGGYDFRFRLASDALGINFIGGPLLSNAIPVAGGLFTVTLNFGVGTFTGSNYWLQVDVKTNGAAGYTTLMPLQAVTPTPYAIYAGNAATASTASNVVSGSVVKSLNNLKDNVTLAAGSNVTITPSGNTLTIASAGAGGSGIWSVLNNNTYYNAGNVGIGTSTPAHRLSLSGGPTWTDSGWSGAMELVNGAAIGWQANQGGQRFGMGHSFGGFYFFRTANNPGTIGSPALYDFVVDDSGNVGIGTTSPTAGIRLDVNGAALIRGGGSGGNVQFGSPSGESGMTIIGTARADLRFDGSTVKLLAGPPGSPPASTSGIAIGTNGSVGVGTTSPIAGNKLEVAGLFGIHGDGYVINVKNSSFGDVFYVRSTPNQLVMYGDAEKSSGGTSWGTFSDRRLKQDVRAFEPGLNEVLQLRAVRFRYRDDPKRGLTSNHEEVGFIAQEVREVIPEAVTEGKDGYLSFKADPIHWAAINAIQGLNQKVDELSQELKRRDSENTELKKSLEELRQMVLKSVAKQLE